MSKRFAVVAFALAGEVSSTALSLEYAQALESDDTCLPGGSSCSLALSQLRASARGRPSLLTEPFDAVVVHADLAASPKKAAFMTREYLEADVPAGQLAPAVSHSELPWASEAANEAEQKAKEDDPQRTPTPELLSELPAQEPTQSQDMPQAPQQAQAQPQTSPDSQPATQELAAQVFPWDMHPKSPPDAPQEKPRAAPEEATKAVPKEEPHDAPEEATKAVPQEELRAAPKDASKAVPKEELSAAPEEATKAVPKEELRAAPKQATKAVPPEEVQAVPEEEDDGGDHVFAGEAERRFLGVEAYTMQDLVAMAGEEGAKVLWDAAARESASNRAARTHHSRADELHSKAPQSHGEPHRSSRKDGHSSHGGPYAKVKGGYKDVVLSRSTTAANSAAAKPVSLSSHVRADHPVLADAPRSELASEAADSDGFARRLRAFHSHPSWIENCTRILLDVGSGEGANIKALYEPESVEGSMKFLLTLQQVFGLPQDRRLPANESGLCALGLEPDPRYHSQLHELKKEYKSRGWNVHFYPLAAWNKNGAGVLSMKEGKVSEASEASLHGGSSHPTEVMSVGLADFVRSLPPKVGVSLLTVDMGGGAEREVISSLLAEEILCQSVVRSALIAGSPKDIVKREHAQRCSGKVTPVVDLMQYLA